MRIISVCALILAICIQIPYSQDKSNPSVGTHRSIPLGGAGTGYVEILETGQFGNITINNNRHQPIPSPSGSFAAIYAESAGSRVSKALYSKEGDSQSIQKTLFDATFPQANLEFSDVNLPVQVRLQAFTPFVLGDARRSITPAAVFLYRVKNISNREIRASIAFSWANIVGLGGTPDSTYQPSGQCIQNGIQRGNLSGYQFTFEGNNPTAYANAQGEHLVLFQSDKNDRVTYLSNWQPQNPDSFWRSFMQGGTLPENSPSSARTAVNGTDRPAAALAAQRTIPAGGESTFVFITTWSMPHQIGRDGKNHGVFYQNEWKSAQQVAESVSRDWPGILQDIGQREYQYKSPILPPWFSKRLLNGASVLATHGVFLENGQFSMFSEATNHPGNLGSPEERLSQSHFFLHWYPDWIKSELRQLARAQLSNGEIPSAVGNLYTTVGSGDVPGGFLGRPDSSAAFILMVHQYYQWTGDQEFLLAMHPHVQNALLWLLTLDKNEDLIPNGPSIWPEIQADQTSLFTADLYLAALRIGEELFSDIELQSQSAMVRQEVQRNLTSQLWKGRYFAHSFHPARPAAPAGNRQMPGAMPGEWYALSQGLSLFLQPNHLMKNYQSLAEKMDYTLEAGASPTSENRFKQSVYPSFAQAFAGSALIRFGYHDACFRMLEQFNAVKNSYSDMSLWPVYHALTGFAMDSRQQCLIAGPVLPSHMDSMSIPLRTPNLRGFIQYKRSSESAQEQCEITINEVVKGASATLHQIAFQVPFLTDVNSVTLRVLHNDQFVAGQDFTRESLRVFGFEKPITLRGNDKLTLILSPQNTGKILIDLEKFKVNNLGAQTEIQVISRSAPNFSLIITNLMEHEQIVNLELKQTQRESFNLFLNGERIPALAANVSAFPLLLQTSSITAADSQWLYLMRQGCETALLRVVNAPSRNALTKELISLQDTIMEAITMDTNLRGVYLDFISGNQGESPRRTAKNASARDLQNQLAKSRTQSQAFLRSLERITQDPVLAAQIVGDFIPLQMQIAHSGTARGHSPFDVDIHVYNPYNIPHESRVSLTAPTVWKIETQNNALLSQLQEQKLQETVTFRVNPDHDLWQMRYEMKALLSGIWENYPFRKEAVFPVGHQMVQEWLIIGPFPNRNGEGFNQQYMPEQNVEPDKSYDGLQQKVQWKKENFEQGYVDFDASFSPNDHAVAYAYVAVYSPREQNAHFTFGSNGDMKIFLNYKEIYNKRNLHKSFPGAETTQVRLFNGWNHIVVKVSERTGPWGFYFEVTDTNGLPLPGVEYSLEKAR